MNPPEGDVRPLAPAVGLPSVPDSWKRLCWPEVDDTAIDDLDLAGRYGAFVGTNYDPIDEWKNLVRSADLGVTVAKAREALATATQNETEIPQRDFVRRLKECLAEELDSVTLRTLEAISLAHDYPGNTGLVVFAIGIKEAAKFGGIIDIKDKKVFPVSNEGDLTVSQTAWLRLT